MIGKALQFTQSILDQFLRNRYNLDESIVVLNNVVDSSGAIPISNSNKIVISLINIEKETSKPFYIRNQKLTNGNFAELNPEERYNLDLLVSSNFDDYNETLKFLNASILFFQINNCTDSSTYSSIPKGLAKLEYDIEKVNYHQMHSLWTAMGAKYKPSAIYKTRLVTVKGNEPSSYTSAITNQSNLVEA